MARIDKDHTEMKVYITKYALTKGIFQCDGEVSKEYPQMFSVDENKLKGFLNTQYFHKPYWHETREDAVVHANQMVKKALASAWKRVRKLEAIKFE